MTPDEYDTLQAHEVHEQSGGRLIPLCENKFCQTPLASIKRRYCCFACQLIVKSGYGQLLVKRNSGGDSGKHKLTSANVKQIRSDSQKSHIRYKDIAVMHGVSEQTIFNIVTRRTWKHIS